MNKIISLFLPLILAPVGLYGMTSEPPTSIKYELSPEARLEKQRKFLRKTSPIFIKKMAIKNNYIKNLNQEIAAIKKNYNEALDLYDPSNKQLKFLYKKATHLKKNLSIKHPQKIRTAKNTVDNFLAKCKALAPAPAKDPLELTLDDLKLCPREQSELNAIFSLIDTIDLSESDPEIIEDKEAAVLSQSDSDDDDDDDGNCIYVYTISKINDQ